MERPITVAFILMTMAGFTTGCSFFDSPLEKAIMAFDAGDFQEAREGFTELIVQNNDPEAKAYLAEMYLHGMGMEADLEKAMQLGQEAAEADIPRGLVLLADLQSFVTHYKKPIVLPWQLSGPYITGDTVMARDDRKAFELYERAARQEYAPALFRLGICYHLSYGVERNDFETLKLFTEAANNGYVIAQLAMGKMYKFGFSDIILPSSLSDQKNEKKVAEWYRKAAKRGYSFAQYLYGKSFFDTSYMEKAAKRGDLAAQLYMGNSTEPDPNIYATISGKRETYYYDFIDYLSSASSKKFKERLAYFEMASNQTGPTSNWTPLHYEYLLLENTSFLPTDYPAYTSTGAMGSASYRLGLIYQYGLGTETDYEKARAYYEKAIEQGYITAPKLQLGLMYEFGMGVTQDFGLAVGYYKEAGSPGVNRLGKIALDSGGLFEGLTPMSWFAKAARIGFDPPLFSFNAESGEPKAQYNLGYLFLHGIGGAPKDPEKAKFCFEKAMPDKNAQFMLGYLYFSGTGVSTDYQKAMEYFSNSRTPAAHYHMGLMYEKGLGIPSNQSRAMHEFREAAYEGDSLAVLKLNALGETAHSQREQTDYEKLKAQQAFLESLFTLP